MAERRFGTVAAVLREDHLGMITAEDRQIRARYAEEASVADALDRTVEENAARAVGVQIDNIELVVRGAAMLVHDHGCVPVGDSESEEIRLVGDHTV